MRSKFVSGAAKRSQTGTGRWIIIFPDQGNGYQLSDVLAEKSIGRILFDAEDNWIYDGPVLNVSEQEDVAGLICGNHKEMNELIMNL